MLSTVVDDAEESEDEVPDALERCDGRLETGISAEEGLSCVAPYMMRAKLRFDICTSRQVNLCRFLIVHPGEASGGRRRRRAA